MMACAKREIPRFVVSRVPASLGKVDTILSTGKGTPIIPVEDGKTSAAATPSNLLTSRQTRWQAFRPALAVAQLALPEFTITARTRPWLAAKDARPTLSGA